MSSNTRTVTIGSVPIGGGAPVAIQSMTNTDTHDVAKTLRQIQSLENAGCDLVRLAVPDQQAVNAFAEIKKQSSIPLIADVHFDYRLALASIDAGADKIRINPGNIGSGERLGIVLKKAEKNRIPVRVGINSGSLPKDLLKKYDGPTIGAMVESAKRTIDECKELADVDLILSIKSSDVPKTIRCYELVHEFTDIPLHIGVTEAGTPRIGTIKSAVGLAILLYQGIGDTLRVSLTGDPVEEVFVAKQILKNLGLRNQGINFISCPTCSRTRTDLIPIAEKVVDALHHIETPITVAVMGCEVNGPGEAREADIGVACGKSSGVLFENGRVIRRINEKDIADELIQRTLALVKQRTTANED